MEKHWFYLGKIPYLGGLTVCIETEVCFATDEEIIEKINENDFLYPGNRTLHNLVHIQQLNNDGSIVNRDDIIGQFKFDTIKA